ncbi:large conductance mechanosensitive channel protein MscL [Microlunatus speluncae]|uniref:large conductance mechanosensitive channel protein MscL n=1 Tax=Microlunatus speluncae TaxID=2594267 RepID=UPI0012660C1B|nr:large conductance mechanosensitive channel protein MscL [Microlunatus speluncae]
MKGFKEFVMRGNLVELAVAVVMATAFAAVVSALVKIILDIVGAIGGIPDFSGTSIGGISVGPFLSALITFVIIAAVVYFLIVLPYNKLRERFKKEEPEVAEKTEDLLVEIRDILRERNNS